LAFGLRWSNLRVGVALVYHRLAETPRAQDLVATHARLLFEEQLRHLASCYRPVRASELLDAARSRRRGEPLPMAITFDDDLRSHLDLAAPTLRRLGLTATFFLSGASLEGPSPFWWDWLQAAMDGRAPVERVVPAASEPVARWRAGDASAIHDVGRLVERLPAPERDRVAAKLAELAGTNAADPGLQREHVRTLASGGFEIGFHTRRHDTLPTLDDGALRAALVDGRAEVGATCGQLPKGIAYPHGRADARVAAVAADVGYEFGFTCRREPVRLGTPPLLIGRLEASFASAGALALAAIRVLLRGERY
jgi:peptidoglycan/xylan/chitin deacetylase (PgdA/CDA1 family)